jgi:hypothetical protein
MYLLGAQPRILNSRIWRDVLIFVVLVPHKTSYEHRDLAHDRGDEKKQLTIPANFDSSICLDPLEHSGTMQATTSS